MTHCRTYTYSLVVLAALFGITLYYCRLHLEAYRQEVIAVEESRSATSPQIPSALTSPEDRAEYFVAHYWDNFDFRDTTLISRPEITEQALVDFLSLLQQVPQERAEKAAVEMMNFAAADTAMLDHFIQLTTKYLYDPNSPLRNEELHIPILRHIIASPQVEEIDKVRPQYQLEMALKNRPGDVATDFTYTLADGRQSHMHALKAEYTILFFNNPDCHDCQRVEKYMAASSVVEQLIGTHNGFRAKLVILAIYPDADVALWRQATYPREVINSYDAGQVLIDKQLYDLKAIPTLYLLDQNKRVILKDAPIEQIEAWLKKQTLQ